MAWCDFTQSSMRRDLEESLGCPLFLLLLFLSSLLPSPLGVLTSSLLLRPRLPVGEVKHWRGNRRSNATNLAVNPTPTTGVFEVTSGLPQQGSGFPFFLTYSSRGESAAWAGRCLLQEQRGWRERRRFTSMLFFFCCCALVKIKLRIICLYTSFLDPAPGYPHTYK